MSLSEISKITEIFSTSKSNNPLLALKIERDQVKSAIWTLENKEVKILALGTREEWGGTKEELLVACDASISSAVTKLPTEGMRQPPSRLVLGLPFFWIKDDKIIEERLKDIHFLSEKLSLKPCGFVTNPEAIAFGLKRKEGMATSAFLIYLGKMEIDISLLIDGKVIQSEVVGRSDNFALDVEEGILRFSSEINFPPRILLYDNEVENLEDFRQILASYPWQPPEQGKSGFLHLPRIEILPKDFEVEAVALAGGEEIKNFSGGDGEKEERVEEKEEEIVSEKIEFFPGKDVLQTEAVVSKGLKPQKTEEEKEEVVSPPQEVISSEISFEKKTFSFSPIFNQGKILSKKVCQFVSHYLIRGVFKTSFLFKGLFLGIFLLLIFSFLSFYFFAKSEVLLTVPKELLEEKLDFIINQDQEEVDVEQKIIPAKKISVEVSGNKKISVVGKKTVGEKAKGEVIIYNRTDSPKTLEAGTVIIGPGKLKFTLDEQIFVASKTPDLVSGVDRWGEAKAKVTAQEIGAQYNLSAGSQFILESFSSSFLLAKNEIAFSGGTSRQISVFSKEDQEKLSSLLEEELVKKAKQELERNLFPDENPVWETEENSISLKKFDHEVGDETSEASLEMSLKKSVLSFKKSDLINLVQAKIASELSKQPGREMEKEQTQISSISVSRKEGENILIVADAKVVLKKSYNIPEITKAIKGKSVSSAKKIISNLEGIRKIEIKVTPGFLGIFSRLPFKQENISVISKAE